MPNYPRGCQQSVMFNHNENTLWWTCVDRLGRPAKPDSAPNIALYSPSGAALVAATAMTAYAGTDTGFLSYDGQTTRSDEYSVAANLTGGTSGALAKIVDHIAQGASGVLELADITGTFQNNETITDDGENTATGTANGTLWQADYYYTLDTTTTSSYPTGKNYCAKVTYDIGTIGQVHYLYFDVSFFPSMGPWVTASDFAKRYPALIGKLPEEWPDWTPAIQAAHGDLVRMLHSLGEPAAYFVKRREEMYLLEMVMCRAEVARALGEDQERIDYWEDRVNKVWASRGEFTYDTDQDDTEVDEGVRVIGSRFTR